MTFRTRLITISTIACVLAIWLALFWRRVEDDDYWGRTTIVQEWGFAREIRMDRDRDGRADVRLRYPRGGRRISHHDRPSEIWIDNDLDGAFEIHWRDAEVPVLEIETRKGTEVIRGPAADIPNEHVKLPGREELGLTGPRRRR